MQIININGKIIAVTDNTDTISSVQDALDFMATAQYEGAGNGIVFHKESLIEDFFDLKTRFAGEILQKFSNYHIRLAIVGDFSVYTSKALRDFIYECNNGDQVAWVGSLDEALDFLTMR